MEPQCCPISLWKNEAETSQKIKINILYDPEILSQENKNTLILITVLLKIAKVWEKTKWQTTTQ